MKFENYTGQDLFMVATFRGDGGQSIQDDDMEGVVLESKGHARIIYDHRFVYLLPIEHEGVEVGAHSSVVGEVAEESVDIPEPEPGVIYIVDESLCRAMPERDDFVCIRPWNTGPPDEEGRVIFGSVTTLSSRGFQYLSAINEKRTENQENAGTPS